MANDIHEHYRISHVIRLAPLQIRNGASEKTLYRVHFLRQVNVI